MSPANPLLDLMGAEIFDTLLPDFILAFALFTALTYAVLGRRFGQQRSAAVMAATIGLALAVGLVWWEHASGWSIRSLGPIAVGLAIVLLGSIIFQALKEVGGTWSSAGLSLGICLLIGWVLGLKWPVDALIIQTLILVSLVGGTVAFLLHHNKQTGPSPLAVSEISAVRHDMSDLLQDRQVADRLSNDFDRVRKESQWLDRRPDTATQVMQQMERLLPKEGWLTERLSRLREKAYLMRQGHMAKIEGLRREMKDMPPEARKKATQELVARYKQLDLDVRMERLDAAVLASEKRIRELVAQAKQFTAAGDYRRVPGVLDSARKLQQQNAKLLRLMERTEQLILKAVEEVAKQSGGGKSDREQH